MLLLGIDEGTTGVKAALFDEELRPVREARRDKVSRHPQPGWVEQDGEEVLAAVVEAVAELLEDAPGEVVACGLDHQGESVLAWDAESGKTLTPIVVWQDKRSQEVPRRLGAAEDEIRELSGLPFDPYFSAAKLAWLLENDDGVARAREAGTLRMGTVDSFLCDRLGAGFATDASTASRTQLHALGTPGFDARLGELFGVPLDVLPEVRDTAGELGVLRHESWPVELPLCGQVVDQQAALAGAGCVVAGRVKATYGTGVFVLGHVGDEVPRPAGGLLPTVAWSHRRPHRVRDRRRGVRRRGDARVDVPRARAGRAPGRAGRAGALGGRERGRARAARAGRHRRAVVAARRARRDRRDARGHDPRARRARGAGGDRLAGGRRGRGDEGDGRRGVAASGRRPDERAAAPPAAGRRDRRAGRSRPAPTPRSWAPRCWPGWARAHWARWPRRRSCCRWTGAWSRAATRAGAPPSTSAGERSWKARPR